MPSPRTSIILPTYNRARFLSQAFASIKGQTYTDWELLVVDDGSTDNSRAVVTELAATMPGPVRYVFQENQGPYGARNTGLDTARGDYIAFFDSDDVWLPHHLQDCIAALETHPDVDWVYGACSIVDYATGQVRVANTFQVNGRPQGFLFLRGRTFGALRLIDDPEALRFALRRGFYCGLQNSVIRRNVFEGQRFESASRNEAEDQLAVIRALAAGHRFALIDNVHVIYHLHDQNSSAAGSDSNLERHLTIHKAVARGFEELGEELSLRPAERRALRQRVCQEYFWHLGYSLLWQHGRREEGLAMYARALRHWPWDWRCWKTYLLALIRTRVGRRVAGPVSAPPAPIHDAR
jgi:glycosyltransferase involved in cell wall biosynthesis